MNLSELSEEMKGHPREREEHVQRPRGTQSCAVEAQAT